MIQKLVEHIFSDGWLNIPNRSVFDTPSFSKLRFFLLLLDSVRVFEAVGPKSGRPRLPHGFPAAKIHALSTLKSAAERAKTPPHFRPPPPYLR